MNMEHERIYVNDGQEPLCVPGFNDVPIYEELPRDVRFAHGMNDFVQFPNLTARELAMLQLINDLTDRADWHRKILDPDTTILWRSEAFLRPLINRPAWDWCLAELRDKAESFERTNHILVFNTAAGICKSDQFPSESLQTELKQASLSLFQHLAPDVVTSNAQDCFREVVDPSLYPLIYGKTRVLSDDRVVDYDHPFDSFGQGDIAEKWKDPFAAQRLGPASRRGGFNMNYLGVVRPRWLARFSPSFQWLPSDVVFDETLGLATSVRLVSYINGIHPSRHARLYRAIESLISSSIAPFNEILIQGYHGRYPLRIKTWGVERAPASKEYEELSWFKDRTLLDDPKVRASAIDYIEAYPSTPQGEGWTLHRKYAPREWQKRPNEYSNVLTGQWKDRFWRHPNPGDSFSFEEWKRGETARSIIECRKDGSPDDSRPYKGRESKHFYYSVAIEDKFRTQGLQVFVRLRSVELSASSIPLYQGDSEWQLDGALNEHIVATALYCVASHNISDTRLTFRQETCMDEAYFRRDNDEDGSIELLGDVFALEADPEWWYEQYPSRQVLGSVTVPQGRLIVFPHSLHYRFESMKLRDQAQPGYARYIMIHLVDPHYRICSTRNVPPQQSDWWRELALETAKLGDKGLPPELVDLITDAIPPWPIGKAEAETSRNSLVEERKRMRNNVFDSAETLNFL